MTRLITIFLSLLLLAGGAIAEDAGSPATIRIGGDVQVSESTAGSLTAAGGQVEVGPDATIAGNAFLAGGNVVVKGRIQGDLHVGGGHVMLDGPVTGDAFIGAGSLSLGPNARVEGKLKFRGGELKRDPAAQVVGGLIQVPARMHSRDWSPGDRMTHGWMWSLGLVMLAALLAGALPGPSQRLAQELRERPAMSALLGFLALTAIPMAALLLMITIIGIPIALLGLVLYMALLMTGYVWLAVVLGGMLLDHFNPETAAVIAWRVGAAALTMIVLAIAVRVPFVGGLVKFAALMVGVGMIVGAVMRKGQSPAAVA